MTAGGLHGLRMCKYEGDKLGCPVNEKHAQMTFHQFDDFTDAEVLDLNEQDTDICNPLIFVSIALLPSATTLWQQRSESDDDDEELGVPAANVYGVFIHAVP